MFPTDSGKTSQRPVVQIYNIGIICKGNDTAGARIDLLCQLMLYSIALQSQMCFTEKYNSRG
jgi:hypothetical protein